MSDKKNAAWHGADFEALYFEAAAKLAEMRVDAAKEVDSVPDDATEYASFADGLDHGSAIYAAKVLRLLAGSDTAALERRDKAVAEQAWDEGWHSRWDNSVIQRHIENPYRTPPAASTATSETSTRASAREESDHA